MFDYIIETDRLILRPFTMDDVQDSYDVNLDPEVTRYTNDGGVKTYDEIHEIIGNVVNGDYEKYNYGRFATVWKETNEFIGFSGLKYLPEYDEVDLGYRFRKRFWGMGIATESGKASLEFGFRVLGLDEIVGFVLPDNTASSHVLKKLGFKYSHQFFDYGADIDKYILAKKDWEYEI